MRMMIEDIIALMAVLGSVSALMYWYLVLASH